MITEKLFTESLEAIRMQMYFDKKFRDWNDVIPPCNDNIIKSIVSLLHIFFPKDENGFCEISHYCFDCDFGKCDEILETPETLYKRLTKK